MSVTFVGYSKNRKFDETNAMELMSYIPFCDGKHFEGMAGVASLSEFDGWFGTAYTLNDPNHHSDDLFAIFETDDIVDVVNAARNLRASCGCDVSGYASPAIGVMFTYGGGADSLRKELANLQRSNFKNVQ